jgi:putative oxygen-independent coproporphyrinogen III oxidase
LISHSAGLTLIPTRMLYFGMTLALYIHWPFCLVKCPYCDFNSHVRDRIDLGQWQTAMLADMTHEASLTEGKKISSLFFGGGTPSLMPPELVGKVIEKACNLWGFTKDIEITLEANPSSVETSRFADLASVGVNRISLGLQSFDDQALQFLGRPHNVTEGLAALVVAQTHFERVSFDLIYALPEQSLSTWKSQLERALAFGTGHLSLYQLTIEPGTRFATMVRAGAFTPLEENMAADMFDLTHEITAAAGLPAYEVSNHARPSEESRHNLTYWRYRDYCGIGPGAHGRRAGRATVRHRKPENWLAAIGTQGQGISEERILGQREQACEAMLMGLRLAEGIDLAQLAARLNLNQSALVEASKLAFYREHGKKVTGSA